MKHQKLIATAARALSLLALATCQSQAAVAASGTGSTEGSDGQSIRITRASPTPPRPGSAPNFSGSVRVDPILRADAAGRVSCAHVTFEAGARTAWHVHPLGQTLFVTAGVGRAQRWGDAVEEIRQGDVVWTLPGQKHWHGAAPGSSMSHVAISEALDGRTVEWMETVSDAQSPVLLRAQEAASPSGPPASYQGESGGNPRLMEVPAQRVDDISCAIDYLVQQPYVDPGRIGSLGICSGGGYAMCNATTELRVKAVATVSMFDLGDARRRAMGLLSYEERLKRLKDAGEQRSMEARGEPVRLVKISPDSPAEFTESTPILYREGQEYYMTPRARHPNSPNRYLLSSLPLQMAFFPFDQVEIISPRPILMVVGERPTPGSGAMRCMHGRGSPRTSLLSMARLTSTCTTSLSLSHPRWRGSRSSSKNT